MVEEVTTDGENYGGGISLKLGKDSSWIKGEGNGNYGKNHQLARTTRHQRKSTPHVHRYEVNGYVIVTVEYVTYDFSLSSGAHTSSSSQVPFTGAVYSTTDHDVKKSKK